MSKKTIRVIIFSVLLLSVAVLVFGFMLLRVVSEGERLSSEIETLQKSFAQEDSYNKLQKIYEETTTERKKLQKYFLSKSSESIDFLALVESLAPAEGVSLSTVALQEITEEDKGVVWIEPTFALSGSRIRVNNFIKILETLPYLLRINNISMTATNGGEWEAEVQMQVRVLSYDQ